MLLTRALVLATVLTTAALPAWAVDTSKEELAQLQQRVEAEPSNPDARFDLAMGLARTVKLEAGYAELRKVGDLDPAYADKVISRYKPMVEENPKNIEAHFRLAFGYYFKGLTLQETGDATGSVALKEQARQAFEAIVDTDPQYVWGYNYLGFLVAEAGDLDTGISFWRQGLTIEDNAVGHFLIGQAYMRQNKMKDAIAELATAMRLRGLTP